MDRSNKNDATPVYRLDRFRVPAAARGEFLARVRETHIALRRQPGFVRDLLLEQPLEDGSYAVATLVEWSSQTSMEQAKAAIQAAHARAGFSPRETIARLGIEAEIGVYEDIPEPEAVSA